MATRSAIYNPSTGRMLYIHFDGYPHLPKGVGMTLSRSWETPEAVEALFAHFEGLDTDISSLRDTLEDSVLLGLGERMYPLTYTPEEAYAQARKGCCEYLYTWTETTWECQPIFYPHDGGAL